MANIIRPYARGLASSGKAIPAGPTGQISIDWDFALSRGLIGAYLPGVSNLDYTGINGPLANIDLGNGSVACTPALSATPEGTGLTTTTQGTAAACTAAGKVDTRIAKYASQISFYVRLFQISSAVAAAGGLLFVQDGSNASSGLAPSGSGVAGNLQEAYYGSFSASAAVTATVGKVNGLLGSYIVGSTSHLYINGGGGVTFTPTAALNTVASTFIEVQALSSSAMLALYFWDHALTAADALALEDEPYGIFGSPLPIVPFLDSMDPFVNVWLSR
jgi:hypothetical protein